MRLSFFLSFYLKLTGSGSNSEKHRANFLIVYHILVEENVIIIKTLLQEFLK